MGRRVQTRMADTSMWARTRTGGFGYVGTDTSAYRVLAGTDVFPEMTVSQKLVFGYKVRFISGVQKRLVLLSLLHMSITTILCIINYT
jgi:hypothetical protein